MTPSQIIKPFLLSGALLLSTNFSPVRAEELRVGFIAPMTGLFAQVGKDMRGVRSEAMSPVDPDTVYENGQYVGRDPDPNVRLELRRDWTHD